VHPYLITRTPSYYELHFSQEEPPFLAQPPPALMKSLQPLPGFFLFSHIVSPSRKIATESLLQCSPPYCFFQALISFNFCPILPSDLLTHPFQIMSEFKDFVYTGSPDSDFPPPPLCSGFFSHSPDPLVNNPIKAYAPYDSSVYSLF